MMNSCPALSTETSSLVPINRNADIDLIIHPPAVFNGVDTSLDNSYLQLTDGILVEIKIFADLLKTLGNNELRLSGHRECHVKADNLSLLR